MKVENMYSAQGNKVANQFLIYGEPGTVYFQSYDTVIAKRENGNVTLDTQKWNYSTTTSKYRNLFLGETTKETQAKINNGTYTLANLNE